MMTPPSRASSLGGVVSAPARRHAGVRSRTGPGFAVGHRDGDQRPFRKVPGCLLDGDVTAVMSPGGETGLPGA